MCTQAKNQLILKDVEYIKCIIETQLVQGSPSGLELEVGDLGTLTSPLTYPSSSRQYLAAPATLTGTGDLGTPA